MNSLIVFVCTAIAKLWRWASTCMPIAGTDEQGAPSVEDHERAADETRVHQDVPAIFLSHSGKQKPFVENLYNALQSANHSAFFDKHTLPKGSPFPAQIDQAARGCKLGVIVLSDDFLNSKWPMLELELLVMKRGPNAKVLPLFYKLSPKDLKSHKNLKKWQQTWKKMFPNLANQLKQAVETLDSFNGEVFIAGTSEDAYIRRVVRTICNSLPSPISYDLSPIKGQERLSQVVAGKFEDVCMVGLHGVGGLGKTTMCKIMANFYNSEYLGKSCLIEFPSDGDEMKVVRECKNALKRLVNLSDEHLLQKTDNFDEVVQLMTQNLRRYDVFLAIDNVWESSRDKAERILNVDFSINSKILVTSRSQQVLKDLLEGDRNTHVGPLPTPDHEEALEIFKETFKQCGVLNSLENRNQLDRVLKRCFFSGSYHALALKAFCQYLKRVCEPDNINHILEVISNKDGLQRVEDIIKLNYVNLQEHKQHIFLDIVAVVMKVASGSWRYAKSARQGTYAKAQQWLSLLYKDQYFESMITNLIWELASDGLIEVEKEGRSERMITVHDLYFDLARKEAASSYRFFIDGSSRSVEKIEWERLERVILECGKEFDARFVEKLQQQECQKLQVLYMYGGGIHFESEIDLSLMPSLCVLKLEGGTLRSIKNWRAATRLAIVGLRDLQCTPPLKPIPSIPSLQELNIENVETLEGLPNLNGCQHLTTLVLYDNRSLEEVGGLSAALEDVRIGGCGALKRMPDLSGLTCLESLYLYNNESLEEVGGLSAALKHVKIVGCGALKRMPDLSGLTCLERLELHSLRLEGGEWTSMTERAIRGLTQLRSLEIQNCQSLTKLEVGCLTQLRSLEILDCHSLTKLEVGCLPSTLQELRVDDCRALQEIGGDLSALHTLDLWGCPNLAIVPDVSLIPDLYICLCPYLKYMSRGMVV